MESDVVNAPLESNYLVQNQNLSNIPEGFAVQTSLFMLMNWYVCKIAVAMATSSHPFNECAPTGFPACNDEEEMKVIIPFSESMIHLPGFCTVSIPI